MAKKYKIHELAKDFNISSKIIIEKLTGKFEGEKKSQTTLEDRELDFIFDVITSENSVKSFDDYFNAAPKEKPKAEPKKEAKKEQKTADNKKQQNAPAQQKNDNQPKKKEKDQNKPMQARTKGEMRHIDTRANSFDAEKYNEKYENIAPANSHQSDNMVKKQKLKQKSQQYRKQGMRSGKKETEAERLKRIAAERAKKPPVITVGDEITVGELASRLKMTAAEVIKKLFALGMMATVNEVIDYDTAEIVATELGAKVNREVVVTIEERIIDDHEDDEADLITRDPVVVVMGHVDHGKTSLLDAIKNTNVTATEAGGITQHIGAYRVNLNGQYITFLDTPGHAAFTSMRARGAQATDVAILVVAADDGIMPQTIEAINHAKAAEVDIIVAINKMDKPGTTVDKIMQQLTEHGLVPEEWGGDIICVPVSAKTHMGIDTLLENILLVAEMQELKANPNRAAKGIVIEARLDKGKGPVATLLVQQGTLHVQDPIVVGNTFGRVRAMVNDRGRRVKVAEPSTPVSITGLNDVPMAGDHFAVYEDEKAARAAGEERAKRALMKQRQVTHRVSLENLFDTLKAGEVKTVNVIIKADVQGSVEALAASLLKIDVEGVKVSVVHSAVGAINESDVTLAEASNAFIIGFNVRPTPQAREQAEADEVDIRVHSIIYKVIEEVEDAMKGMLDPEYKEKIIGEAIIRETFKVSKVGTIGGFMVSNGKITRDASARVIRDGVVIFDGKLASLKHFKDDVKEIGNGQEGGLMIENYNDIKVDDVIEAYVMEEIKR